MTIYEDLLQRQEEGNPIKVGVIGAGQMGHGMISQISTVPGMIVTAISDINVDSAEKAAESYNETSKEKNDIFINDDFKEVINHDNVEIVVEATGVTEVGAQVSAETLLAKKHLVLLNVEIDITIGSLMKKLYDAAGLVYTGSDGDEPAATLELYELAKSMGMEVLVAGKGKNNPLKIDANPDTAREEAESKNMNPAMLASFQDGTKTMSEMTLLSNATGFVPDKPGMHGIDGDLDSVIDDLDLKDNGGVLDNFGVVEYVNGLAPGVFVIVKGQNEGVREELNYLMKKGERDHHILYRPFHLASLETPITVAKTILNNDHAIAFLGKPVAETVAVAKRDIKENEQLDPIGGFSVRGVIETHDEQQEQGYIPIGLITGDTVAKRDISKGSFITEEDVELDKSTTVYTLRKLQDDLIG